MKPWSGPSRSSEGAECFSDLKFDRWLAGELNEQAERVLSRHLQTCARCQRRADELRGFQAHARQSLPGFRQLAPAIQGRTPSHAARSWKWWLASPIALAAAAAALAVLGPTALFRSRPAAVSEQEQTVGGETRIKGGTRLSFYVKRKNEVFEGVERQELHPGDAIQFRLHGPRPGYVAVLSLDGAARVSSYYPPEGGSMMPSSEDGLLPQSTVLDPVLGPELFAGIWCERPVEIEILRTQVAKLEGDRLDYPGCSSDLIHVEKTRGGTSE